MQPILQPKIILKHQWPSDFRIIRTFKPDHLMGAGHYRMDKTKPITCTYVRPWFVPMLLFGVIADVPRKNKAH